MGRIAGVLSRDAERTRFRLFFCISATGSGQTLDALKQTLIDEGISRIGFAKWPKWRLFGFRSDPQGAISVNIRPDSPCKFLLNYECEVGGSIRAELPEN